MGVPSSMMLMLFMLLTLGFILSAIGCAVRCALETKVLPRFPAPPAPSSSPAAAKAPS